MPDDTIVQLFISPSYVPVDSSVTLINSKIIDAVERCSIMTVVLTVATEDTSYNVTPKLSEIFPSARKVYRVRSYEVGSRAVVSVRNLLRKVFPLIFYVPDYHFVWEILAVRELFKIKKECRINIIHSVSAPYCSHIVGFFAKLILDRPWVCHLDDFWADQRAEHFSIFRPINRWLEKKCFEMADVVLSTSNEILSLARARYPESITSKFLFIPPCYEPAHYPAQSSERKDRTQDSSRYCFNFLGVFYPGKRDPMTTLTALKYLKVNFPAIYDKITINFIGANTLQYLPSAREIGVDDAVTFRTHVDYLESMALMTKACVLVHLGYMHADDMEDIHVSGKLFEYVGAQRLIFGITTPTGPVADFVRKNNGIVANYADPIDIANNIMNLVKTKSIHELMNRKNPEDASRLFSSESVALAYSDLFKRFS